MRPRCAALGTRRWICIEAEDHYLLKADLPGMSEDDVNIEFERGVLSVSGERKEEHSEHGEGWHRIERASGRFSRQLSLPEGIDADGVTATFDRGVLSVRIPKPERVQPRRIAIGESANGAVEGTAPREVGAAPESRQARRPRRLCRSGRRRWCSSETERSAQAGHAWAISRTCRRSVPQHPPSTLSCGSVDFRAA